MVGVIAQRSGLMDFQIRAAQMADIPHARAIQRALVPDHPYDYARNFVARSTCNFVAVRNGKVIGFTSGLIGPLDLTGPAMWQRAPLYVAFVGVDPNVQGQGVGSALLSAVCAALFSASPASHVYLECDRRQAFFYEKNGFAEVSVVEIDGELGAGLKMRTPFRRSRGV